MKNIILLLLILTLWSVLFAAGQPEILIFYKEKEPSQRVLARVDSVLNEFRDSCQIKYYNVMDEENKELAIELGLPQPHLPFAVVINGKFTAKIDDELISFVYFPLFMKGIGRHEGNWSMDYLMMVLENNELLYDKNILPSNKHNEDDE
ncbi:MAG: hypothetical protein ACLFQM_03830, partial [Fidelibacterota bacterium]